MPEAYLKKKNTVKTSKANVASTKAKLPYKLSQRESNAVT